MIVKKMRLYSILVVLLLVANTIFAQKPPIKFGKVDHSELTMTQYEQDTSARAVILCDYGTTNLEYETTSKDFYVSISRHVRFKILKQAGTSYANFEIPLYRNKGDNETIVKFKAATYNMEDGKMVTTDVKKDIMLAEERSENWVVQKIPMPEVKEGTVFEIQYFVRSPFYWYLQDWQFQYSIPVMHSEYRTEHPEWFHYNKSIKGYDFSYLTVNEQTNGGDRITFTGFARNEGRTRAVNDAIDFRTFKNRWVAENMPAFEAEAYSSSVKNYLTAVKFELSSTQFPNAPINSYTKSWEDINRELLEAAGFGGQLLKMKTGFLKDKVASLTAGTTDHEEKIAAIFRHVQSKMNWNESKRVYATSTLKKAYESGSGSSADINLLLTAMLKTAGLNASPVILSTRDHGFVNPYVPSLRQYNYVVSCVQFEDGKFMLLDATDKTLPPHLIPARCINSSGLLVSKEGHAEVPINPGGKYRKATQCKLKLNEDGEWVGNMKVNCKDYAARTLRRSLSSKNEEEYIEELQNENEGLTISESNLENTKKVGEETKEDYLVTISDQNIDAGDMLYFNPMLMFGETENPFKLEDRKYPVDYNFPYELIYSSQFEIPEGYSVEEFPEKAIIALPNKGGRFVYTINVQGNIINTTSQIQIRKHLFLPEEYGGLKQFYDIIIEKHGAQIVLKKKT